MAFSPYETQKSQVSNTSVTLIQTYAANPTMVEVHNSGPSVVFFRRGTNPAVVDADYPVMPGQTKIVSAIGKAVSLVSENQATVYVTFGGGDLN